MTNTHPLAGNPYAEHHQHRPGVTEDNEQWAIAQATLALVFEQRTANLIALAEFYGNDGHREHGLPILNEINTRLGLNGEAK